MTSTSSTQAPAIVHVTSGTPDGIVRLFVPTGVDVAKVELQHAAQGIAKTVNVGRVPAGKPGKWNGISGHVFDFAPVVKRVAATPVSEAEAESPLLAMLIQGGMPEDAARAVVSSLGEAAYTSTPRKGSTVRGKGATSTHVTRKGGKGKGKGDTFRDMIAAKAQARQALAESTCTRCLGHGKSLPDGSPRTRKDGTPVTSYPFAFRTLTGANSSPRAIECPQCKGTGHAAKGKGKRSA